MATRRKQAAPQKPQRRTSPKPPGEVLAAMSRAIWSASKECLRVPVCRNQRACRAFFRTSSDALALAARLADGKGGPGTENSTEPLVFTYRNWRGETARRRAVPRAVVFGCTEYHPKAQWLLEAWDVDKAEARTFALADVKRWHTPL